MNKPTFVLITALWKRPELTNVVLERFKNLKIEISDKFNLELIAVGSEGSESKKLSESKGFLYIEYKNSPLNIKFNQACIAAKKPVGGMPIVTIGSTLYKGLFFKT